MSGPSSPRASPRRGTRARAGAQARRARGAPTAARTTDPIVLASVVVLFVLAAAALFLTSEAHIARRWGFALDDSWIHAQIARNLVGGNGFTFNPGERVAGSTGPLYTILLALFYSATGEMVWAAKVFGMLCQCASAVLVLLAMLRLDPKGTVKALFAALVVGLSPSLLWASLSGMEIPLYVLLVCLGIYFYAKENHILATAAWSLGVWVRPDGLFLVALSFILVRRDFLRRALTALPILLLYFAFNHVVGGTLFPQTVAAKTHFSIEPVHRTWNLVREWTALWGLPFAWHEVEHPLPLLLGLAAGAAVLWRRHPLLAAYAVGLPLALSLFRDHSGSAKRYMLYVIPFGAMLAAHGFEYAAGRWFKRHAHRALIAAAALTLVWQGAYLIRRGTLYGWNVQNINQMQCYLGGLAKHMTRPGDRVATNDIGGIAYFSERRVVDLMGLVTPREPLPRMLSRYRPELLIIFVDWFKDYADYDPRRDTFTFFDADSSHQYSLIAGVELSRNTISAKDQMLMLKRFPRGASLPEKRLLRRF